MSAMVEAQLQHWRSEASACAPPSAAPSRELPPVAPAHSAGLDAAGAAAAAPPPAAPGREPPRPGPDPSRSCRAAAVPPEALGRARLPTGPPEVLGSRRDILADPLGAGSLEQVVVDPGEGSHAGRGRGAATLERGAFASSTYAQHARHAAAQPRGGGPGSAAGRPDGGGTSGGNPLGGCATPDTGCVAAAAGGRALSGRAGASGGAGGQPGPAPATAHAGLSAGDCGAGVAPPAWPARLLVSPFALQAAQLQRSSSD
jgi:hypothetical protein